MAVIEFYVAHPQKKVLRTVEDSAVPRAGESFTFKKKCWLVIGVHWCGDYTAEAPNLRAYVEVAEDIEELI